MKENQGDAENMILSCVDQLRLYTLAHEWKYVIKFLIL